MSALPAALIGALTLFFVSGCRKADPPKKAESAAPAVKARFPKPQYVRGLYMNAWSAGRADKLEELLGVLDRTELNAVVIDVRDAGRNYFRMNLPLSDECGATDVAVTDAKALMAKLEKRGVYPIARISCFRDRKVPLKYPDRGVNHIRGGLWKDRTGNPWLDPFNRKNWEYIGQIVDFALDLGFPEVQLDYVRFPSEGKVDWQVFPARQSYGDMNATQTQVVAAFSQFIRDRVSRRGALLSADIFGIVSVNRSDHGIGQALNMIAAPFDVLSPMLYPSHFHKGEYSVPNPNEQPYDIVKRSLDDYRMRVPNKNIRPWLQDFQKYSKDQIREEIRAVREAGFQEYLMWNAANRYVEAAYKAD